MLLSSRYRGALLGLAVGDAVGTPLEFTSPGTFEPISDMVGGGPFALDPGQWTDDTSMALCLAESLVEQQGFDAVDQMQRYMRWYRDGYLSSTGTCFDIGNTVRQALHHFERTREAFAGSTDPHSAGNGSLMRLAPVPLYYATAPEQAIAQAAQSSRTTHGAPAAVDACRFFSGLIVGTLQGCSKDELLAPHFSPVPGLWSRTPLHHAIDAIAAGSYKKRQPPAIKGTGYVVDCLEAALWAFYHGETYEDAVLLAVNLGQDADTTGAVCGQLAGAYYGAEAIPTHWLSRLALRPQIEDLADRLATANPSPMEET